MKHSLLYLFFKVAHPGLNVWPKRLSLVTKPILDKRFLYPLKDFSILKEIGEGKYAKVFKASHQAFSKDIVIRFLKVGEAAAINRRKLEKETKELISIQHDNIVKHFGLILEKSGFLMEYCCAEIIIDARFAMYTHYLDF